MPCLGCAPDWRFAIGLVALALLTVCGCGPVGENLIPVSGKVTVKGKPLTRGSVSFRADRAHGNTSTAEPYGAIEADGTYKMYTNQRLGAPAGKYIVLVTASEDIDPKNPSATPKSLVDAKYADPDKPIVHVEVAADARPGQYDLELGK